MPPLSRRFYRRDPLALARALLGQVLVRTLDDGATLAGRIVEVEAYLGVPDRAAHTFGGRRTARNASMWLDAGHAYVYFTYGMHYCFNVTADRAETPTACLIRALDPIEGEPRMREHRAARRSADRRSADRLKPTDLCSGPAKLTQALRIDRALDGVDLTNGGPLYIRRGAAVADRQVVTTARVGVGYAGDWAKRPLRLYVRDNPHVSMT